MSMKGFKIDKIIETKNGLLRKGGVFCGVQRIGQNIGSARTREGTA